MAAAQPLPLLCIDILLEIFEHLDPYKPQSERAAPINHRRQSERAAAPNRRQALRTTLLACALLCRELSPYALNILWRTVYGPVALLTPLPIYCLHAENGMTDGRRYMLHEDEVTDSVWACFETYAARVLNLSLNAYELGCIHNTVWVYLSHRCGTQPLLPRLQRLTSFPVTAFNPPPSTLFVSPNITHLNLDLDVYRRPDLDTKKPEWEAVIYAQLDLFSALATRLGTLEWVGDLPDGLQRFFSIRNFPYLHELHVSGFYPANLRAISVASPALRTLQIAVGWSWPKTYPHVVQLPYLDVLVVEARYESGSDPLARRFLSHLEMPRLSSFTLEYTHYMYLGRSGLTAFDGPLLAASSSTLQSFTMRVHISSPSIDFIEFLRPLLAPGFPRLETVHFEFSIGHVVLDDRQLREIARLAPPTLTSFALIVRGNCMEGTPMKFPTLHGLVALMRGCPALLSIEMPGLVFEGSSPAKDEMPAGCSLRELRFLRLRLSSDPESDGVNTATSDRNARTSISTLQNKVDALADILNVVFPELCVPEHPSDSLPDATGLTDSGPNHWPLLERALSSLQRERRRTSSL